MQPIEQVLARLPDARRCGAGWSACCPAHDDRRPSLSISEADDGTVLLKCHAGCDTKAIVEKLGLELRDLFPPKPEWSGPARTSKASKARAGKTGQPEVFATAEAALAVLDRKFGRPSRTWTYTDAAGETVGLVARWDRPGGKEIRPVSRRGDGWAVAAMPSPRPLYRLPDLAAHAKLVVVCEGEKAATRPG
jgi:hypothetical protein